MTLKIPHIIGHRGACGYAPENTLESIHTAADIGASWVELDVKLTKDDVPILFHDDTLERTTNGYDPVAQMTYDDIRQLEAGSWFSDSFTGVKIPTLDEALQVIFDRGLGLNLEIKPCQTREQDTAEAAMDVLAHYIEDDDQVLISSFQHSSLEIVREMMPTVPVGFLAHAPSAEELPDTLIDMAHYFKAKSIHLNLEAINDTMIDTILRHELLPAVYTVNDGDMAKYLFDLGVHTIFSDTPDELMGAIPTKH